MTLPEQNELPGPTPPRKGSRPSIWWIALATIVAIAALAAAFMLGRTTTVPTDKAVVQAPAGGSQPGVVGPDAGGSPPPVAAEPPRPAISGATAQPGATNADFLITDRLLAHPLAYEDLQNAPTQTSVCLGGPIRIANLASRRLGLIETPDESDASATLGFVEPGAVFTLVAREPGTFFISAAGGDGLLFRYMARRCAGKSEPSR